MDFDNTNKGEKALAAGEYLLLKTFGYPARLEIITEGAGYKVTETGLGDEVIIDQDSDAEEGWNTVYGDTWKTESDSVLFDGVTSAVRVRANSTNESTVIVAWEVVS